MSALNQKELHAKARAGLAALSEVLKDLPEPQPDTPAEGADGDKGTVIDDPLGEDDDNGQTSPAKGDGPDDMDCPKCSGSGKYEDQTCDSCEGTGKVPKSAGDGGDGNSDDDGEDGTDGDNGDDSNDEESEDKGKKHAHSSKKRTPPKPGETIFKAAVDATIDDPEARMVKYVASDESVDRYGDIITASGWSLENFVRNPVFLFAHDSSQPPIGRVTEVAVKGKKLIASVQFMPEGMSTFCDSLWKMVRGGFLKAVSVGFFPTVDPEPMIDKDGRFVGYKFLGQELVELSLVPVPANPNALQLARSFGATDKDLTRLFTSYNEQVQREVSRSHQLLRGQVDLVKLGRHGR